MLINVIKKQPGIINAAVLFPTFTGPTDDSGGLGTDAPLGDDSGLGDIQQGNVLPIRPGFPTMINVEVST